PVLVLLRDPGDLVPGRADPGLQIVQQTHEVPSLAAVYVRAPSPASLPADSEDCCLGMSTDSPEPTSSASLAVASAVSRASADPCGSADPAASSASGPVGAGSVRVSAARVSSVVFDLRKSRAKTPISTPYVTRAGCIPRGPVCPFV